MTHGAVLQNETGLPSRNRPLLITLTIKKFPKKSSEKRRDRFCRDHDRDALGFCVEKNQKKTMGYEVGGGACLQVGRLRRSGGKVQFVVLLNGWKTFGDTLSYLKIWILVVSEHKAA